MAAVTIPAWGSGIEVAEATVANLALARLGAEPIKDTTEETPSSRQARAAFAATRDELLRDYEFSFAQRAVLLSEDGAAAAELKAFWTYAYIVPTSPVILKILEVGGNRENLFEVVGSGAGKRILCDLATSTGPNKLAIKYVEQVADPAAWDSLFKDAMVLRLASKLAIPLAKRPDLAQALQAEFAAIFTLAKRASSEERQTEEAEVPWTEARGGTVRR